MKTITLVTIWAVSAALGVSVLDINDYVKTENEHEVITHDWECKYVIRDYYSTEVLTNHYVDSYVENVDRSISFVASDGLITRIPYPYYEVIKNPNM